MQIQELRALESSINESNHLDVVSRLWNAYNRGTLNVSLTIVSRILKTARTFSPVNPTIDSLLTEHNISWKKAR